LLELEHVVVKELLEIFVGKVNAKLFKAVHFEDFETSNIQNTNESSSPFLCKNLVDSLDNPQEHPKNNLLSESSSL